LTLAPSIICRQASEPLADTVRLDPLSSPPGGLPESAGFTAVRLAPWRGSEKGPESAELGGHGARLPQRLNEAVSKRKLEYLAGRLCAARAAEQIGVTIETEISTGPQGEPFWPQGLTGSISHSSTLAAAVVAQGGSDHHIGLDLESLDQTRDIGRLAPMIVTPREAAGLCAASFSYEHGVLQLFCLKEAFYKAIYPVVGRLVDFQEVSLSRLDNSHWRVAPAAGLCRVLAGWDILLRHGLYEGHVLAFCAAQRVKFQSNGR